MNSHISNLGKLGVLACAIYAAFSSGCEWSGGAGVTSSSSRYSFVNFGGVYRGHNGGLLVTDYTKSAGTSVGNADATGTSTNTVYNEEIAKGNGVKTAFAGYLNNPPILKGTLTITAPPAFNFIDSGGSGTLTDTSGSTARGTVNYITGAWSINFPGALDNGASVIASYQFTKSAAGSGSGGGTGNPDPTGGSAASGTTGAEIHSFTVEHYGNVLNILDNNGMTYKGKLGDIRGTGGVSQDSSTNALVRTGDEFIGNFTAKGTSAAQVKVQMVGTFQGTVLGSAGNSFNLGSRLMLGTWVEAGGRTGDITGEASPITITP